MTATSKGPFALRKCSGSTARGGTRQCEARYAVARWYVGDSDGDMRVRGAYGFGIARSLDVSASRTRLAEVCEIASRATGVVFFPHHALTYRELAESIVRGDLGAAW